MWQKKFKIQTSSIFIEMPMFFWTLPVPGKLFVSRSLISHGWIPGGATGSGKKQVEPVRAN